MQAIMVARLYAMYQRPRNMLIFLSVFLLASTICCVVLNAVLNYEMSRGRLFIPMNDLSIWLIGRIPEELVLSGTYQCTDVGYNPRLVAISWVVATVWEVLALCLAVWIVVKHFRELQRSSTEWTVATCLSVLIKTHLFYFAA